MKSNFTTKRKLVPKQQYGNRILNTVRSNPQFNNLIKFLGSIDFVNSNTEPGYYRSKPNRTYTNIIKTGPSTNIGTQPVYQSPAINTLTGEEGYLESNFGWADDNGAYTEVWVPKQMNNKINPEYREFDNMHRDIRFNKNSIWKP